MNNIPANTGYQSLLVSAISEYVINPKLRWLTYNSSAVSQLLD
jgi:hypothetical protein